MNNNHLIIETISEPIEPLIFRDLFDNKLIMHVNTLDGYKSYRIHQFVFSDLENFYHMSLNS